jgi:hypothetical protein
MVHTFGVIFLKNYIHTGECLPFHSRVTKTVDGGSASAFSTMTEGEERT